MRIAKLEPSKRKKGRFLVHLDGGDLLRVGEREVVTFALYTGQELSEETLEGIKAVSRESGLRDRALNMITARPLSRKGLMSRLQEKEEASETEAEEVADWLERLGLLNDMEYAKMLVRHYTAKGYGPYRLRDELYRRGVPKDLWDDALGESEDPADSIDALLQRKLKGKQPDRKELKRASDMLARRGYKWADIRAALCRYGAEIEEE